MTDKKAFFQKMLYAVAANFLSLAVSLATTLLVPKFLGNAVEQYGYLQIYLFYFSYIGFFHFGLCDGIYLRDGGKQYEALDRPLYSAQFWILTLTQVVIALGIAGAGILLCPGAEYRFVCIAIAVAVLFFIPRNMLAYFLQATNRIREYSLLTTVGRLFYGVSILFIFFFGRQDYRLFVYSDLLGHFLALLLACYYCRDIIFSRPAGLSRGLCACAANIRVGIKLLFANMAGMLITGIVRMAIQWQWDVATYGRISFTLSVSNFILTFITAVAVVLYPTLKRASAQELPLLYPKIRDLLTLPLLLGLSFYYPMELLLSRFLPQYAESMRYMAILFPFCLYATQTTLLVQTYMNVLRMEKSVLRVNVIGVLFACLTTFFSVFVCQDLTLAMVSIVLNQMFRSIYAELVLSRRMGLRLYPQILLEAGMTAVFILANWFVRGLVGVLLYLAAYVVYLAVRRSAVRRLFCDLKHLLFPRASQGGD